MNIKMIVVTGSLVLSAGAANAALVLQTRAVASSPTPFSSTFSIDLFDGSLGTLNAVSFSLLSHVTGSIDVINILSTPQAFTDAFARIPVKVTSGTLDATSVAATYITMLASGTALSALSGTPVNSFAGVTGTASNAVNVLPSDIAKYVGLGGATSMFTVATTGANFGGTSVPGVFFGGSAVADATFKIQYDYSPLSAVPLPPAPLLLFSGLALAAMLRRRRS
jgi:hypothetical protein